jgi:hypothetical protein
MGENMVMKWLQRFKRSLTRTYPPIISTEWGAVSEGPRRQAAENIKRDPALKAKIVEMLGEAEARRRYPEAF